LGYKKVETSNLHHLESAIDNASDVIDMSFEVVDIAVDGVEDLSDDVFYMLPNSENSDDGEEYQCSDEVIENMMNEAKTIEKRWRTDNNTNLRGRGTIRSIYFAAKNKVEKLVESARVTHQITHFSSRNCTARGEVESAAEQNLEDGDEPAAEQNLEAGDEPAYIILIFIFIEFQTLYS
jgi:hypothetical protein